jgi:cytochrome bd-type quinol oxidase subunit 1
MMPDTFMKSFVHTLLFNLATIAAVIVGVVSYAYRAARVWYANGGRESMIAAASKVSYLANKLTEKIYFTLEDAEYA